MPSPFDSALAQADSVIENVMMSACVIAGNTYNAILDEEPKEMEALSGGHFALNGSYRTLTLFKSQGYKPKRGDVAIVDGKEYAVTGFGYRDGLLILQVE